MRWWLTQCDAVVADTPGSEGSPDDPDSFWRLDQRNTGTCQSGCHKNSYTRTTDSAANQCYARPISWNICPHHLPAKGRDDAARDEDLGAASDADAIWIRRFRRVKSRHEHRHAGT